jgi:hypothetical protein
VLITEGGFMNKKLNAMLTVAVFSRLVGIAQAQENQIDEGFVLRCESVVGENPDKLVIEQEYDFAGKTDKPLSVTLHTFASNGGGLVKTEDLNKVKYEASEHYLRHKDKKVVIANLSAVNDGLEVIGNVEYSATNKSENIIKATKYTKTGIEVIKAQGESVECSIEKL